MEPLPTPAELVPGVWKEREAGAAEKPHLPWRHPPHRAMCAVSTPVLVLFKPSLKNPNLQGPNACCALAEGTKLLRGHRLRTPSSPSLTCSPVRPPSSLSPHHRHWCHGWQIIGFCLSSQLLPSTSRCQGSFLRDLAGAETTKTRDRGDQNEQPAINPPHALRQGAETSLCKAEGTSRATHACCLPVEHCPAHAGARPGGTTVATAVATAAGTARPKHSAHAKPLRAAPLPVRCALCLL